MIERVKSKAPVVAAYGLGAVVGGVTFVKGVMLWGFTGAVVTAVLLGGSAALFALVFAEIVENRATSCQEIEGGVDG